MGKIIVLIYRITGSYSVVHFFSFYDGMQSTQDEIKKIKNKKQKNKTKQNKTKQNKQTNKQTKKKQ